MKKKMVYRANKLIKNSANLEKSLQKKKVPIGGQYKQNAEKYTEIKIPTKQLHVVLDTQSNFFSKLALFLFFHP